MLKNKPVPLIIASALMILLIIAVGVFQFAGLNRGFGGGPDGRFQPGNMPPDGNMPNGGNLPKEGALPGNGDAQPGFGSQDGSNPPGFQRSGFSDTSMRLMQLLRGFQISAAVLIMGLGILSIVGMLLLKKWGRIWAIVTSVIVFLIAIPGLFQRMFGLTMIETLVKITLAVAIFVLCLLPKSRQPATATPAAV